MNLLIISLSFILLGVQDTNIEKSRTTTHPEVIGTIDVSKDATFKKKKYNVRTVKKDSVVKKAPVKQATKPKKS